MRKLKLLICSLLLSVLVFSTTVCAYDPRTDVQYEQVLNGNLYLEDASNMSQIDADMLNYVAAVTPLATNDLFVQEDVRIYFTKSVANSDRTYSHGRFDGMCYSASFSYSYANNKILKVTAPVAIYIYSNTYRADTYIHECGHAFDNLAEYITGYYQGPKPISNSAEWQSLYAKYAGVMATFDPNAAVNMYNSAEAFAEAYRFYYSYPQQLQASCPEVYTFVGNQIAKYQGYVSPVTYENFYYELYALAYPDVVAAVGDSKEALWNHYVNYGKAEGRIARKTSYRK